MYRLIESPRDLGLWCAAGAVALGIAYMAAAGAPARYMALNAAALGLGAALWLVIRPQGRARLAGNGWGVAVLALSLLATAILASPVEGASRWLTVGPLSVQVSLVLLPPLIVLFARSANSVATLGIGVAALALAAQPDRGMAGVLAVATAALVITRGGWWTAIAFAMALAALGAAMLQADGLPAVPYVDRILYTAFDVHLMAGLAVAVGCLILVVPGLAASFHGDGDRPALVAFGATWAAVTMAAAIGNYPTPLVGYGGSAVLGYVLSVALLPARNAKCASTRAGRPGARPDPADDAASESDARSLRAA